MIVQAIGLLDELDKEINTYAMRVKEWFGWHFPEMAKVGYSAYHWRVQLRRTRGGDSGGIHGALDVAKGYV